MTNDLEKRLEEYDRRYFNYQNKSEDIKHEHPKKNSGPFYPHHIPTRLYEGNNKVHSMTVTKYKNGEPGPQFFISGKVLTEYKYNSRENTFTKKG